MKSEAYLAQKALLQREAEANAYSTMLSPTPHPSSLSSLIQTGMTNSSKNTSSDSEDPLTPSLVFNILLSSLLCGFAVFWASRLLRFKDADSGTTLALRVALGMGSALIVLVAEVGVFMAYVRKVGDAREVERKKRERKRVVGVIGEGKGEEVEVEAEVQEIWGRGKNLGVRRRVREGWERDKDIGIITGKGGEEAEAGSVSSAR